MRKILTTLGLLFCVGCGMSAQQKLTMLEVGMSKEEVRNIMGQPDTSDAYGSLEVWKYRESARLSSIVGAAAGSTVRPEDSPQLLPIAFEDGRVIGWGEPFVTDKVKKYEVRIR